MHRAALSLSSVARWDTVQGFRPMGMIDREPHSCATGIYDVEMQADDHGWSLAPVMRDIGFW